MLWRLKSSPSSKVRDLGVMFDSAASMEVHVTSVCRSASYAIWIIGKVRNILDKSATEKLLRAFVTSWLDYCNSLLFGLHANQIKKLQLIRNSAVRLVMRTRVRENITVLPCFRIFIGCQLNSTFGSKFLLLLIKSLKMLMRRSTSPTC